jgi:hypothetical protein
MEDKLQQGHKSGYSSESNKATNTTAALGNIYGRGSKDIGRGETSVSIYPDAHSRATSEEFILEQGPAKREGQGRVHQKPQKSGIIKSMSVSVSEGRI